MVAREACSPSLELATHRITNKSKVLVHVYNQAWCYAVLVTFRNSINWRPRRRTIVLRILASQTSVSSYRLSSSVINPLKRNGLKPSAMHAD